MYKKGVGPCRFQAAQQWRSNSNSGATFFGARCVYTRSLPVSKHCLPVKHLLALRTRLCGVSMGLETKVCKKNCETIETMAFTHNIKVE